MPSQILVRYGELALKSAPVRREFEGSLRRNILDQFVREGLTGRLRADHGHLYVEVDDGERALRVLRRVFGITSVSLVHEVPSDRTAIRDRLLDLSESRLHDGASFAVRARRTGGHHPFTSQELARDLGGDVLERFPDRHLRVDLEAPDVELFVEVRGPRTYLSFDRLRGPGGLPLGVAGHLVALVDGPRGALGAFLMMKRGCRVGIVALPDGESLARGVLGRFDPSVRITAASADPAEWSAALAQMGTESHADGVVLPIGVDEYPDARVRWGEQVLFSPTVGWTDSEVSARWKAAAALTE
ncbi:MAG TPA: THUMP domain-containing protein [Thermoplasmata archaeon]|nr:THUMP domain-containing protein [Thermoplasmata archaeon]